MAYEIAGGGTGMPMILGTGNNGDGFGGGGLGGLLIGALLAGGLGGFGGYGRGAQGADVALTAGIQNQINTLSDQVGSNAVQGSISALASNVLQGITATNQAVDNNSREIIAGVGNLQASIATGNFTTLSSINGLGRDVTAAQNQGALQQLNSFNNLTTTTLQGFNEVGRDQANSFNQVQMSLNAIAAANAACCCEIKAAISADGNATRALINDIRLQELQGQLTDAKSTINSLNIINALKPPTTPVIV